MIHPIIGNHRENCSLDCGLIVIYLNARIIQFIQFIEILKDNRLPLVFKGLDSNLVQLQPTICFIIFIIYFDLFVGLLSCA